MDTLTQTQQSVYGKFKSLSTSISPTYISIIVISLVFISIALFYYFNYMAPKTTYKPNSELNNTGTSKSAELLFFYADWCPHCKTAKPIWEELKTEYKTKTINGYTIIFNDINCSEENPETEKLLNQYNVEGFPTIKLLKDGQVIEYDAKPTKATLVQFLNAVL